MSNQLFTDISHLIESARLNVARHVNSSLVLLYWQIGRCIREEILKSRRADYGENTIQDLSKSLQERYGKGFGKVNLLYMVRFAAAFPEIKIVQTLSEKLSWSHFVQIIPLDSQLKREFYCELSRVEGWSIRVLKSKIQGMLYERTAIAKKPEHVIQQDLAQLRENNRYTADLIFKDPYTLEFLDLQSPYNEREFEQAILHKMELFLLELGGNFTFVERQKRITLDGHDYSMDMVFFHRKLRCLIVFELKLGKFQAAHKGQMELYLRWLEKYEVMDGENPPLGVILCSEKSQEQVELLQLEASGIRVARYLTELPPREVLQEHLQKAIVLAREQAKK